MTRPQLTIALGAALLVVSCEPLPVYPPGQGPPRRDRYDDRNDGRYNNPDSRYDERGGIQDDRYDNRDVRGDYRPEAPRQPTRDQYPVARSTDNPDQVISPFAPYNVIDVQGFRSGQLAKDPSNQQIFRIP